MKFGLLQQEIFGTSDGAYSSVTATEVGDSQITLTDYEAELVIRHFGAGKIHVGNVRSNPLAASKEFCLYPTAKRINLNLVYPKPEKGELRLYLREAFKPKAQDVWFVFRKNEDLFLGSMSENKWRSLGRIDDDDDEYISLAAGEDPSPVPDPRRVFAMQYPRNPALARQRFRLANFSCEFNPKHRLFVARATGEHFLEPHHLVMVSLQNLFKSQPLDVLENIFALCPYCHRAVHHAEFSHVRDIVSTLVERRPQVCKRLSLTSDKILRLYNCETITK